MQCSQNSLYWKANLKTLNWTGVIFVSILFAHSELIFVNIDPEKIYGLKINPSE